jgi:GNAT superfamily N-acetyltransferase
MKMLLLMISCLCLATIHSSEENIRQTLQALNESVFYQRSIEVKLLKDYPEAIPVLAQWMYDEWHPYDQELTVERLLGEYQKFLSGVPLPFAVVALKEGRLIGVISLSEEGEPEFEDLRGIGPWVGSFEVVSEERNKGLGQELGFMILAIARKLGYSAVNFYTSNPDNVPRYLKKGAEIVEERPFRGHMITIMKMSLERDN